MAVISSMLFLVAMAGDPEAGVSEALAQARREQVSELRYDLTLAVPTQRSAPIEATARLSFSLVRPDQPLVLDFHPPREFIDSITSRGEALEWRYVNHHIVLPRAVGELEIRFRMGDGPLNRNDEYLYSLFVPARAHHAIPCFDQPDIKGRFRVSMTVPEGWVAFANQELGVATEPLPTYLWHFAAGRFQVETETRKGRRIRMFHREPDAAKVARNRTVIFDLHFAALAWMEEYTGIAIRSASSISWRCRPFNSAAWNTPGRSVTTRMGCSSMNRPRSRRSSVARA